ncbi:MAG: MBL fold metallo-hydrolase [Clostridiales bacterium]|jgi:L-ascorbate metabolism protein UlaG (beta-lactamase superfamily)|nr:MBL fold metallo-hydrolase [Clostridiales bacterium]
MEITYIGHACFLIRFSTGLRVCFDPYGPGSVPGLADAHVAADEVFCSHSHQDHSYRKSVVSPEDPYNGPAPETEIIRTYHDDVCGAKRGENNITIVRSGGETVVHMGDIGCDLTGEQTEKIKGCDLLMIPVGGFFTIGCAQAFDMCCRIDPKTVIPMHFSGDSFGYDVISGREEFIELVRDSGERKIINGGSFVSGLPSEKALLLMDPLQIL